MELFQRRISNKLQSEIRGQKVEEINTYKIKYKESMKYYTVQKMQGTPIAFRNTENPERNKNWKHAIK
jgi:hypothetical protein